jgi:hypothetical protein
VYTLERGQRKSLSSDGGVFRARFILIFAGIVALKRFRKNKLLSFFRVFFVEAPPVTAFSSAKPRDFVEKLVFKNIRLQKVRFAFACLVGRKLQVASFFAFH